MLDRIINFIEESNIYSLVKDMERVLFQTKRYSRQPIIVSAKADPHKILKTYSLEIIKGIGPKTRQKLEKFGIKTPYDLIHSQQIQGFSQNRINNWKQFALKLQ